MGLLQQYDSSLNDRETMGAEELTDAFNKSLSADVQPDDKSAGENG